MGLEGGKESGVEIGFTFHLPPYVGQYNHMIEPRHSSIIVIEPALGLINGEPLLGTGCPMRREVGGGGVGVRIMLDSQR